MTIIDDVCKSFCKCNYNSLAGSSSAADAASAAASAAAAAAAEAASSTSNPSEGFINYEKDVKGNEFRLLIFIIILLFIAKLIF